MNANTACVKNCKVRYFEYSITNLEKLKANLPAALISLKKIVFNVM